MNRPARWHRFVAAAVVACAVPALAATSPEPDPQTVDGARSSVVALDADTPAALFDLAVSADGGNDLELDVSVGHDDGEAPLEYLLVPGDRPAAVEANRIVRGGTAPDDRPLDRSGSTVASARCRESCSLRATVVVRLVGSGEWSGVVTVVATLVGSDSGQVSVDLTRRPAAQVARPSDELARGVLPPSATPTAPSTDSTLPDPSSASVDEPVLLLRLAGPADAVRATEVLIESVSSSEPVEVVVIPGGGVDRINGRLRDRPTLPVAVPASAPCPEDPCVEVVPVRSVGSVAVPVVARPMGPVPDSVSVDFVMGTVRSEPFRPNPNTDEASIAVASGTRAWVAVRGFDESAGPAVRVVSVDGSEAEHDGQPRLVPLGACPADAPAPCRAVVAIGEPGATGASRADDDLVLDVVVIPD